MHTRALMNAHTTGNVRLHPRFPAAAKPVTGRPTDRFPNAAGQIPMRPAAAGAIETRPAISTPGDAFEQEADRLADAVTRLPGPQIQRACPCGGGCPKCRTGQPDLARRSRGSTLQPGIIQRKLVVGQANDPLEHEADRVADQVMGMVDPGKETTRTRTSTTPLAQRRVGGDRAGVGEAPTIVHDVLSSPG